MAHEFRPQQSTYVLVAKKTASRFSTPHPQPNFPDHTNTLAPNHFRFLSLAKSPPRIASFRCARGSPQTIRLHEGEDVLRLNPQPHNKPSSVFTATYTQSSRKITPPNCAHPNPHPLNYPIQPSPKTHDRLHHLNPRPLRPIPHRLPPRRRRPHRSLQLALRPPAGRRHDPPHRRHRRRSQQARTRPGHHRRPPVARPRLGRGPVLPIPAPRSLQRRRAKMPRQRQRLPLLLRRRKIRRWRSRRRRRHRHRKSSPHRPLLLPRRQTFQSRRKTRHPLPRPRRKNRTSPTPSSAIANSTTKRSKTSSSSAPAKTAKSGACPLTR